MPFSIINELDRQLLRLEGVVTIHQVRQLAALLVQGLKSGITLAVNTEGLEDIDACILQLLLSVRKTVPALSFENPSRVFISAVDRCGLRRELPGIPEGF